MMYYEIKHSGIKGQKWGIRKYQNPDGTLTPEGKIRYGGEYGKVRKEIDEGADPRIATMKARQEKNKKAGRLAIAGIGGEIGGSILGTALKGLGVITLNVPLTALGDAVYAGSNLGGTIALGTATVKGINGMLKINDIEREYKLRS